MSDLGDVLRELRRRDARRRAAAQLTYRELAGKTGWSHSIIAQYFAGTALPPTDRFDVLVRLLGAAPAEQGVLAAARDRVEEHQRRPSPRPAGRGSPVPRQLPPDVYAFAGRAPQLAGLDALAVPGAQVSAVVISAISGTAGVGKTALAVHWAHRVAARFPDGQLYVNLRGFDPTGAPLRPSAAVRGFLDAFDVPADRVPVDLDAQATLYRTLLADRRVLVVLDNARDADQARPLLPGAAGCLAVITSRDQLTGLVAAEGAHHLAVDPLTPDEARQLLAGRLGADRVAAEPAAVDDIVALTARLPLALTIVAARALARTDFPLRGLADELRDRQGRLDALDAGEPATDVRAVFSWSYDTLSPGAARLFRLVGLHPGPELSARAAASLAGRPLPQVRRLLAELTRAHLLEEPTPGRYTLHDLLRAYAADLARHDDDAAERRAAVHRVLDHYLHSADAADRLLYPHRDPLALAAAQPGVDPERPADHDEASAWFAAERAVLLAAVECAAATGFDAHAWRLAWALRTFLDRAGHWHEWAVVGHTAVAAARRLDDPLALARAESLLAHAGTQLGRYDDAYAGLSRALDLYRRAGELAGQAHTHVSLAELLERQDRHRDALDHDRKALDLYRAAGHRWGQAYALNAVGWDNALLGDHRAALAACQQALVLLQELGDRTGQADTWDSLGYAHHHLGDHARAVTCYQNAVEVFRNIGDRYNEATTLVHLGEAHEAAGDLPAARAAWREAVAILDALDHPDAHELRTRLAS